MNRLVEGLRPNDAREVVRIVAGILIAVGMVIVAVRRDSPGYFEDTTSNFGLFVIFGLPAGFLYGAGVLGRTFGGYERRWQALYTVLGVLLLPVALFFLIQAIDTSYDSTLWAMIIFALSAAACVAAWLIASVRFQLLLGSVYAGISWLAFLDKVLGDDPSLSTIRWLLLLFAVGLVAAAFLIRRRATVEPEASFGEILTGAGLVALLAFALGPIVGLESASTLTAVNSLGGTPSEFGLDIQPQQEMIWDLVTLITGIALVLFGLGRGLRGQVYVGGAMLLLFVASVGLDLDDASPEGKIVGWPLLLCILGALAFLASLAPGDRIPPALGLGRWFEGGRDGADEAATTEVVPAAEEDKVVDEPPAPAEEPGEEPPRT